MTVVVLALLLTVTFVLFANVLVDIILGKQSSDKYLLFACLLLLAIALILRMVI